MNKAQSMTPRIKPVEARQGPSFMPVERQTQRIKDLKCLYLYTTLSIVSRILVASVKNDFSRPLTPEKPEGKTPDSKACAPIGRFAKMASPARAVRRPRPSRGHADARRRPLMTRRRGQKERLLNAPPEAARQTQLEPRYVSPWG